MKYASICIKIHCVGLLPVAVCTHMNDSIVWDRALCCSVPVYKATLILHKYLTTFWDVWDFYFYFLSKVPFLFLCNDSLDLHVSTVAVTMGKCSRVTSVNLIKLGRGIRAKKMYTMKIPNKILPFLYKLCNKNHTKESTLLGRNSFKFLFI